MVIVLVLNEDGIEEVNHRAQRYGLTQAETLKVLIENSLRVDGVEDLHIAKVQSEARALAIITTDRLTR